LSNKKNSNKKRKWLSNNKDFNKKRKWLSNKKNSNKKRKWLSNNKDFNKKRKCVLLPENLRAYFELSAQAWILYKAPQWNARYPNSCPERIKLKMH
jgi:hypothetical protein